MYNLIDSPKDDRDYKYSDVCGSIETLPTKFINPIDKILDQKSTQHCTAYASAYFQQILDMRRNNKSETIPLSPSFSYYYAKKYDGLGQYTKGTTLRAICEAQLKNGMCKAELYNDSHDLLSEMKTPTDEAIKDASQRKIDSYFRVETIDEIRHAIVNQGGVIASIQIFSGMLNTINGWLQFPTQTSKRIGNHAVYVCGFDDNIEAIVSGRKIKGVFVIMSSYGDVDSVQGKQFLPYAFITEKVYGTNENCAVNRVWRNEAFTFVDNTQIKNAEYQKQHQPKEVIPTEPSINMELTMGSKEVIVNGIKKQMTIPPLCINGSNLVPMRFIFQELGYDVIYTPQSDGHHSIVAKSKYTGRVINMNIGYTVMYSNNEQYLSPVAPIVKDGNTLIPLRMVSEMAKCKVDFDNSTKKITIAR